MKILILLLSISSAFSAEGFKLPSDFFFGVANAPAQVEDNLDDAWMEFAEKGRTAAFKNHSSPTEKLQFWSRPEIEIDLAAKSGVTVFRMGMDWGRVMPEEGKFDEAVLHRYQEILEMVKARKMKVMLSLMHHSVPKWLAAKGGWTTPLGQQQFVLFAQTLMNRFHDDVSLWITFNEGNIFAMLTYSVGIWPPGIKGSVFSPVALGPFKGAAVEAMDRMADAHNEFFDWAHAKFPKSQIGLAHNMAFYTGKNWLNRLSARFISNLMNWRFPDRVGSRMDFFGFNYYGAEWIKGSQIDIDPEEEYSDAGRAVYPQGLLELLKEIHERYPKLPILITENGIGDSTDILRPAYLIEHLAVVNEAIKLGIPVKGYVLWSLTDNFEWADGYCPKFGIVAVDRANGLKRVERPSFELFSRIAQTKAVSAVERDLAWNTIQKNVDSGRPFCRHDDGVTSLNEPVLRKIVKKDWRFNP